MNDRTSTKVLPNGAIRYGVYDEAGNFVRYEYIKPEDEPTQEGTPINKATLLSDGTAEQYGFGISATVDNALAANPTRVGDLKQSVRANIGDRWLLCNGDKVSESSYPELYSVLRKQYNKNWTEKTIAGSTESIFSVVYANGYFVAVGGTGTTGIIYYTTDPNGNWTKNTSVAFSLLNGITFGNGYFVAVGNDGNIYYTTNPAGAWALNKQGTKVFRSVAYGNGYFVAVGDTGTLYWATNPTGTWTSNSQHGFDSRSVAYGDGVFVSVSGYGVIYSSDPSVSWNKLPSIPFSNPSFVSYANGYWTIVARDDSSNNRVFYSSSITGTFAQTNVFSANAIRGISFDDGYWIAVGSPGILYYTDDITSNWIQNNQGIGDIYSICFGNELWVAGKNAGVILTLDPSKRVPLVTNTDFYTYIKAL